MTPEQRSLDIEHSVTIAARRDTVFKFFGDPMRWQRWMGEASTIRPGADGEVRVRTKNAPTSAGGKVSEWIDDERVAFEWTHDGGPLEGVPMLVRVELASVPAGTRVTLVHEGLPTERDVREQAESWRHYLGQLSLAASRDEMLGKLDAIADTWTRAWSEPDDARRVELLAQCFARSGRFRDPYGYTDDRAALCGHIAKSMRMTNGAKLERTGPVDQCHAFVRWPWRLTTADGAPLAKGVNLGELDGKGVLKSLVSFWD